MKNKTEKRSLGKNVNTKQKGNSFERDCSRMLSLWWTGGKRDDAIWRSASSGALTTVGKGRYLAHTGDFAATDGDAELLFKHVIIEAKRGYSRYSVQDLLDVPEKSLVKNPVYEMLIKLVSVCAMQHKVGWLLWKKDRRELVLICTDYAALAPNNLSPCLIIPNLRGYRLVVIPWKAFSSYVNGPHLYTILHHYNELNASANRLTSSPVTPVSSSALTPATLS